MDRTDFDAFDDDALRDYVERQAAERKGNLTVMEEDGEFAASVRSAHTPPGVPFRSATWTGLGGSWREAMEYLAISLRDDHD